MPLRNAGRMTALLALAAAALAAGGCGGSGPAAGTVDSPVRGVLTAVADDGHDEVVSVTLRTADGASLRFRVQIDDDWAAPTAAHLREHVRRGTPVVVAFRGAGGRMTAHRIDDA